MLVQDVACVSPLILWYVCIYDMVDKDKHDMGDPEYDKSNIPMEVRTQLYLPIVGTTIVTCLWSPLSPVVVTTPTAKNSNILGSLVTSSRLCTTLNIHVH